MKRRIVSLVTLAALLCLLCATVHGSTDLVFVAVDDSIPLTLPADAAPFYSRGVLYVPATRPLPPALCRSFRPITPTQARWSYSAGPNGSPFP